MKSLVEFINEGINWKHKLYISTNGRWVEDFSKKELDDFWKFLSSIGNEKVFDKIKETDQDAFAEKFWDMLIDKDIQVADLSVLSDILNAYATELYQSCSKKQDDWGWRGFGPGKYESACMFAVICGKDIYDECINNPTDKKWKKMFDPKKGVLLWNSFNNFMYYDYVEKKGRKDLLAKNIG